ncbi:glycosyltransferase family 4 protein [Maribellus maritimus]|uniref:glycosyltransferase family 4 protein n=1 Tax=Maribellus maritimus TaxID=2870838 RepID=UPI001EEBB6BB|nr:glycosyltransferase family 4 protein [Maribellus maritimus]MCG6188439.1 glycosyltransferase family 4 protein [Maribellus maritimus]
MEVVFLTKYFSEGPSSRYRSFNYSKFFDAEGVFYTFSPLFYDGYVSDLYLKEIPFYKVVKSYLKRFLFLAFTPKKNRFFVIEKELFPNIPFFIEQILLRNKNYSIDYDDAVFIKYNKNFLLKNKHLKLARKAKFLSVGNYWYFTQFSKDKCVYLPTVIDIGKYPPVYKKEQNKPLIICWIGTPSNIKYLKALIPVFKKLRDSKIEFKLRIIGGELYEPDLNIENIEWREKTEHLNLAGSDIGIMPLFDSKWESGKCGFKLIQYMISHLPVIASPSPANKEIISHGENGYIASTDTEWIFYLSKLCEDSKLREEIGQRGHDTIIENYSYQKWGPKYVNLIKQQTTN